MAGRPSIYGICRDLTGLLDYSGSLRIKAIRTIKNRRKRKLPILKYFPYVKRVPLTGSHDILKSEELLLHFTDEATGGECPMVVILHRRYACCVLCLHPLPLTAVLGSTVVLFVMTFAQMSSTSKKSSSTLAPNPSSDSLPSLPPARGNFVDAGGGQ